MKKIMGLFLILAGFAFFAACGGEKTELEFTNSADSDDKINDIVWADGDATWNSTDGYAVGTDTGLKEVSKTSGNVDSSVWDAGASEYVVADVTFSDSTSSALSLSEGGSNKFTLVATNPAASPKKK